MEEYTSRNDVTLDKDVILPAEKKVTLQPLHSDVNADDESDIQIAAAHANGTPIGNITSDREATTTDGAEATAQPALQNSPDAMPLKKLVKGPVTYKKSYGSILFMAIVIAILLFTLLYK